jgi:tripartite ATP-independent transporter DctM subunit
VAAAAAASAPKAGVRSPIGLLLSLTDAIAAVLLAADLAVVIGSVTARSVFNAPVEWSDDIARGLMVGSSFFGAASALARSENAGISFFVDRMPSHARRIIDSVSALLVVIITTYVAFHSIELGYITTGQTTGSGLPLELTFYPMGIGAGCMTVFATDQYLRRGPRDVVQSMVIVGVFTGVWLAWNALAPGTVPGPGPLMLIGFALSMCGGMAIGFALALAALIYIWAEGALPGVIFAQQMARGIDNFVLLAIPFFILVGYLMEANGMSVRLIALLERLVGRMRGGLNVVMVLSMMIFSGISGSKMADVAAVGSVLVPAARRSKQNPGNAVALLAASAVMAEAIPPCLNLIILGFVANLSIGGLFMAGLVPAGLMALSLIAVAILFGTRSELHDATTAQIPLKQLWTGAAATVGLIVLIFGGFKSGFATATEISAFAALYALVVGSIVFRELGWRAAVRSFTHSAVRSGLIMFIVASAQSLAFVLTLQQIPHAMGDALVHLSQTSGTWMFMTLSIAILIVMGSVLEGAAALIIFGPMLVPVAATLGIAPLHFGVVLVVAMGIGLFAPPLGLGLYGACLVGNVPIESTVKPILGYLGLLTVVLLFIAFVPGLTLWLPNLLGYH